MLTGERGVTPLRALRTRLDQGELRWANSVVRAFNPGDMHHVGLGQLRMELSDGLSGPLRYGLASPTARAHDQPDRPVNHSITRSARWRSDGGIVSPRALAVVRLIASSNLVGCSTGRSRGLAPLRIRSV